MDQVANRVETPVWLDPRAIALLLAASLTTMANATISPALAGLEEMFADHPHAALLTRLLVPAPSLTVVLFAPLAGWAADRYGRRPLLLAGVILFVVTGCAGLFLPDLTAIFASRLALGIAVAMIMTTQTALIGDYFTGDRRNAMTGLQVSARNFGGFVFIALAGWLAIASPRLPFAVYGLAAVFLPLMWMSILEPPIRKVENQSASRGAADGHVRWIPLICALAFLQMLTTMIFFMMPTQLPFFFDALGHDSAAMTGAGLGALTLAGGCAALFFARIKRAIGFAGAYGLGYGLMAAGFLLLPAGFGPIFAGLTAIGIGFAIVMPNFVAIALTLTPAHRRGLVGGLLTTSVFVGQFVSPFISLPSIATFGYDATFQATGLLLVALTLVATCFALMDAWRLRNSMIIGTGPSVHPEAAREKPLTGSKPGDQPVSAGRSSGSLRG